MIQVGPALRQSKRSCLNNYFRPLCIRKDRNSSVHLKHKLNETARTITPYVYGYLMLKLLDIHSKSIDQLEQCKWSFPWHQEEEQHDVPLNCSQRRSAKRKFTNTLRYTAKIENMDKDTGMTVENFHKFT